MSKTGCRSAAAALFLGPGMGETTVGPVGSSEKKTVWMLRDEDEAGNRRALRYGRGKREIERILQRTGAISSSVQLINRQDEEERKKKASYM